MNMPKMTPNKKFRTSRPWSPNCNQVPKNQINQGKLNAALWFHNPEAWTTTKHNCSSKWWIRAIFFLRPIRRSIFPHCRRQNTQKESTELLMSTLRKRCLVTVSNSIVQTVRLVCRRLMLANSQSLFTDSLQKSLRSCKRTMKQFQSISLTKKWSYQSNHHLSLRVSWTLRRRSERVKRDKRRWRGKKNAEMH